MLERSDPIASISSKNNIKDALSRAISAARSTTLLICLIVSPNRGDTSRSVSTTHIGILYFLAKPLVKEVLPVPGGPYKRTVRLGFNLVSFNCSVKSSYFFKALKKSSKISFFTSFPNISSTVSLISSGKYTAPYLPIRSLITSSVYVIFFSLLIIPHLFFLYVNYFFFPYQIFHKNLLSLRLGFSDCLFQLP